MSCSSLQLQKLVTHLQRLLPAASRTPVAVAALTAKWPDLPEDYVFIMAHLGAGDYLEESWYFYPEPYPPERIPQAKRQATALAGFYLIAEDQDGWYLGYDSRQTPWQFCEFDAAFQPVFQEKSKSLCAFLCREFEL